VLADQVTRRLPEEDLSRLRGLLQTAPRGSPRPRARPSDRRVRDDGDRAGVDADADPERNGQSKPLPELGDALPDIERGPDGAERVVVARRRHAEHAEDASPAKFSARPRSDSSSSTTSA
jgi:hypothetical protein